MPLAFKSDSYADAQAVRRAVFMDEQGFQNEFDEVDERPSTIHVTAYDQAGALVGCARVFPDDGADTNRHGPGAWIFGRLAVMPEARGSGAGSLILAESERLAQAQGAREMHLHAQCRVQPFYQRAGYEPYGDIELDEHVEHQWMGKQL